jgi:hypothetical protein
VPLVLLEEPLVLQVYKAPLVHKAHPGVPLVLQAHKDHKEHQAELLVHKDQLEPLVFLDHAVPLV